MPLRFVQYGCKARNRHVLSASPIKYVSASLYLPMHPKFGELHDIMRCQPSTRAREDAFIHERQIQSADVSIDANRKEDYAPA